MWWYTSVILAFGRQKLDKYKFKASLEEIDSSRIAWATT